MTVTALIRAMPSSELTEWIAYSQIEPFGPARADLRAGEIVATLINLRGGHKGEPVRPRDVFPDSLAPPAPETGEEEPQSWEEQLAICRTLHAIAVAKHRRNLQTSAKKFAVKGPGSPAKRETRPGAAWLTRK